MKKYVILILCLLIVPGIIFAKKKREKKYRGITAKIESIQVTPSLNVRRLNVNQTLAISIDTSIKDSFNVMPTANMRYEYRGYRKSVTEAIKKTFNNNFSETEITEKEKGSGLELLLLRAEMLPTTTIKYHAILLKDGQEIIDLSGETTGRVVQSTLSNFDEVLTTLSKEAIEKMCEAVYDGVFRSQKLEDKGFWESIVNPGE